MYLAKSDRNNKYISMANFIYFDIGFSFSCNQSSFTRKTIYCFDFIYVLNMNFIPYERWCIKRVSVTLQAGKCYSCLKECCVS